MDVLLVVVTMKLRGSGGRQTLAMNNEHKSTSKILIKLDALKIFLDYLQVVV